METAPLCWPERASVAIRALAARPASLFLVLLAVNALARPYAGISHDARLYSAQALHQLNPATFGDDLFFRYGSQDQFSVFSRFAAPLVGLMGLEPAFLVLYIAFSSLLILAMKRLVETLIEDRLTSTLALLFMVVAPLNFGGLKTLHVHEPFLTSRLISNAFVLLGLERTLRRNYIGALVLILCGMAFHPLMALGGLFIWAGSLGWQYLPGKALLALALSLAAGGVYVLASPTLAEPLFGTMDDSWREVILRASPFNFVSEWTFNDWGNAILGLIGVTLAATLCWPVNKARAQFLALAGIAGVLAIVGTAVAESLPYALPLQGQPYRALWIVKVLQVPLAIWFASRLWVQPAWYGPPGGVLIAFVLSLTADLALEWCFPIIIWALLLAMRCCGFSRPDWYRRSLAVSLLLGSALWAVYKLALLAVFHEALTRRLDTLEHAQLLVASIGQLPWLLICSAFLVWAWRRTRFAPGFQASVLSVALLVPCVLGLACSSPFWRENFTRYGNDIEFARRVLTERPVPHQPSVYSCLGRLDLVWLDLNAKSYFDWWQMGGVMYQRPMAIEGQRRALVVGPFELDRFRETGAATESTRMQVSRFFNLDFDNAKPKPSDLEKLCRESDLDFLLLTHEFPGYVTAGNGRIFLYDCRQVCAALNSGAPTLARHQSSAYLTSEGVSP